MVRRPRGDGRARGRSGRAGAGAGAGGRPRTRGALLRGRHDGGGRHQPRLLRRQGRAGRVLRARGRPARAPRRADLAARHGDAVQGRGGLALRPALPALRGDLHPARRHEVDRVLQHPHALLRDALLARRPAPPGARRAREHPRGRPLGQRRRHAAAVHHAAARHARLRAAAAAPRDHGRHAVVSRDDARALARRAAHPRAPRAPCRRRRRGRLERPAADGAGDRRLDHAGHRQLPRRRARRRGDRAQRRAPRDRDQQARRALGAAARTPGQTPAPGRHGHRDRRGRRVPAARARWQRRHGRVLRRRLDRELHAARARDHADLPPQGARARHLAHAPDPEGAARRRRRRSTSRS